ncbi:MAG: hypothetical protein HC769_00735 [Cyanobacteria bacterium CRU_2_1]|nr:hypothetical protein [Cyanobacteria bacterium CRU_2_1]
MTTSTAKAYSDPLILADAHTHIYDCFDPSAFFNSAFNNFEVLSRQQGSEAFQAVLFLTETRSENYFEQLYQAAQDGSNPIAGWSIHLTEEDRSLYITNSAHQGIFLVAGSQIVVEEDLEVLALATTKRLPDGLPLANVIHQVVDHEGIPTIPWGFGKWMGRRGKILSELLQDDRVPSLFLGDNSGRPSFWSDPPHFKQAIARKIRILPGTDPLPFDSETDRAGRFGFAVPGSLDVKRPAAHLKQLLLDPNAQVQPYGALETPFRFFRNQVAMQIVKRTRKAS